MAEARMSSFMPTIKCSMCGGEIAISMMGEHVCPPTNTHSSQIANSAPEPRSSQSNAYQSMTQHDPASKRMLPPNLSTSIANGSNHMGGQRSSPGITSTPAPQTSQFHVSRRPLYGHRPIKSPPSPETLSPNLDSAFPPFRPSHASTGPANSRHGERQEASISEQKPPSSTNLQSTVKMIMRMNSIAPGPFNPRKELQRSPGKSGAALTNLGRTQIGIQNRMQSRSNSDNDLPTESRLRRSNTENVDSGISPFQQREPLERSHTFPAEKVNGDHQEYQDKDQYLMKHAGRGTEKAGVLRDLPQAYGHAASRFPTNMDPEHQDPATSPLSPQEPYHSGRNSNLTANYSRNSRTSSVSQSSNVSALSSLSSMSSRSGSGDVGYHERDLSVSSAKIEALMMDLEASIMPDLHASSRKHEFTCTDELIEIQGLQAVEPGKEMTESPSLLSPPLLQPPLIVPARLAVSRPASPVRANPAVRSASAAPSASPSRRQISKGLCKGCCTEITGKSVSSADGRLSGRYHKACFVCKTCSAPFPTADFYVHGDAPYCERHYHQLNNSMCKTCDRGIEGQYLETESGTKHHPSCLTCEDCRVVLRHDYFEIDGRMYCERDVVRRSKQRGFLGPGGPTTKLERRTTRMMMI